jgi:hypothetical protein
MIQQLHLWVYTQNNLNKNLKRYLCTCDIEALFMIAKEESNKWLDKMWYKYNVIFSIKKEGYLSGLWYMPIIPALKHLGDWGRRISETCPFPTLKKDRLTKGKKFSNKNQKKLRC